jgi:hypothetical protein
MGSSAQTPAPNGVQGIGLRFEDLTAPVPGGTIGGETRRLYIERPARVNRRRVLTSIRSASGTRSIPGAPCLRKAGGLSPLPLPAGGKPTLRPETARAQTPKRLREGLYSKSAADARGWGGAAEEACSGHYI